MILIKYKANIITYIFSCVVLIVLMLFLSKIFYVKKEALAFNEVLVSKIEFKENNTSIYVEYPRFNENDEINQLISDDIYKYIRSFKSQEGIKTLHIKYKLFDIEDYINIQYYIDNSLSPVKYRNLLLNLNDNRIENITSLYDEDLFSHRLYSLVAENYDSDIYSEVLNKNINDFTYIYDEDNLFVYFNNIREIPYVAINIKTSEKQNYDDSNEEKYIAFTYDDGPSEYTLEILDILEANDSSATFFMVGSKMKESSDIVKAVFDSKSEIGAHGYSHSVLKDLKPEELEYELNTTEEIFESITNSKLKYLRPPYGSYDNNIFEKGYDVISWSYESNDWLTKDENTIVNNVVNNACDGCIVLFHDNYYDTLEATRKLIKELNSLGYKVVSVSKLMEIKDYIPSELSIIDHIE